MAKETFATGRPLEDSLDLMTCKHCKKSVLKTAAKSHINTCLKQQKEKQRKKKEAKEARERAKKEELRGDKDDDGDTRMDSDDDDDVTDKKAGELKSTKKAGKKVDLDDSKKGKKRKADGDAEKGPKAKKKKEEVKPKAPKPKGMQRNFFLSRSLLRSTLKARDRILLFSRNDFWKSISIQQ